MFALFCVYDSFSFDWDFGRMTVAVVEHWDCLLGVAARRDACSKSVPPLCFLIMYLNFSLLRSPEINQTPTGYMTLVSVSSVKRLIKVFK